MHFFSHKKPILPLPDGCTPEQIQIESSICTGETTIGLHDMGSHRLTTRKKKTAAFHFLRQSFSISMFLYVQNLLL